MSSSPQVQEPTGVLPIHSQELSKLPIRKPQIPERNPSLTPVRRRSGNILHPTLNVRQLKFVEYYVAGKNPYQAAKLAGYAESTCANATELLLNNKDVREEIGKRFNNAFHEKNISNDDIFTGVARCAFSNMFDYINVLPNGEFKVNLNEVPREMGYAIQEISHDAQGRPKIRLVDKKASFELLGRFRHMAVDKLEVSGKEGGPLTIQALDAIVQQNITINQIVQPSLENQREHKVLEGKVVEALPESPEPTPEKTLVEAV